MSSVFSIQSIYIMKKILLIILIAPALLSTDKMSIRGEILTSINNKNHSIYVNHIFDDALALADAYDIQASVLIAQACILTRYGKRKLSLEYIAYQIALCSICAKNRASKKINKLIIKYKLYKLENFA